MTTSVPFRLLSPFEVTEPATNAQAGTPYYRSYAGYLTESEPNSVRPWFDGVDGFRGILNETATTQLLTEPEDFSDAYWTTTSGTLTADQRDPTPSDIRAFLFEGSSADGSVSRGSITAGTYAYSVYAKDVNAGSIEVEVDGVPVTFNLATGDSSSDGTVFQNLLTYSEEFDNAAYNKTRLSVSADAEIAPDGSSTADALIASTVNNTHQIHQNASISATAGVTTICLSFYFKSGVEDVCRVTLAGSIFSSQNQAVEFDAGTGVATATVGNPSSFSMTPVGDGWYRCFVSAVATDTDSTLGAYFRIGGGSFLGDGTSDYLYVWGAQVNYGSAPTPYLQTTSAAKDFTISDIKMEPYADDWYRCSVAYTSDGTHSIFNNIGNADAYLFGANLTANTLSSYIDSAATRAADDISAIGSTGRRMWTNVDDGRLENLFSYSEAFNETDWTKSGATITANQAVAPDGETTADLYEFTGSGGFVSQSVTVTDGFCVFSLYVKRLIGETDNFQLLTSTTLTTNSIEYDFDTNTASLNGATNPDIIDFGFEYANEDYIRLWLVLSVSAGTQAFAFRGDSANGFYVWGAQAQMKQALGEYAKTEASSFTNTWSPGTYSTGDQVIYDNTELYTCVAATTTTEEPSRTASDWAYEGKVNSWKPFDLEQNITIAATAPQRMQYIVQFPSRVDSITLMNLIGSAAKIDVVSNSTGENVFSQEFNLISNEGIDSFYDWYLTTRSSTKTISQFNVPALAGYYILITIDGPNTVQLGKAVIGLDREVGTTLADTYPSVKLKRVADRPRNQFGVLDPVNFDRSYAEVRYLIRIEKSSVNYVNNVYRDLGAGTNQTVNTVFVADPQFPTLTLFGYVKDYTLSHSGVIDNNTYTLTLEEV